MKVKTANLKGPALDWAVAYCLGKVEPDDPTIPVAGHRWDNEGLEWPVDFEPSQDWGQAGPIIQKEKIAIRAHDHSVHHWSAEPSSSAVALRVSAFSTGPDPLVAAMRCFVAIKMGDEIEIPDELVSNVVAQVKQAASPRTKVAELKGSDLDLAVATANPAYVALSPAAKAAAICAFTSGIQSYDEAVALYDAMAASDEPLDALIEKYPDVRRWGPVEELSEDEWWLEVEMLADSIMRAEAHFTQASIPADSQDEGDDVTDAPRPT